LFSTGNTLPLRNRVPERNETPETIIATLFISGRREMEWKNLLWEKRDRISVISINRPRSFNALNVETIEELGQIFSQLAHDEQTGAVILTGVGDKSFVSGADIAQFTTLKPLDASGFSRHGQWVFRQIENLNKPVIAAVNGYALGGGCELALACHLRIASEKARFGLPEVTLGLIPGYGGTQRLARLVGKGRALELILTGEMIDAPEAYRIGLVNKVVPAEKLLEASIELAQKILKNGPIALKMALQAVTFGLNTDLETGTVMESNLFGLCYATQDREEGVKAFLEKRKPVFKGQ
jgi:enoyl-CoA hydratase